MRVLKGCMFLADVYKWSDEKKQNLRIAVRIHEIGKIGVRRSVLKKRPHELTEEEITLIHSHPVIADSLFAELDQFSEIAYIIKHLRENYDGSGSPDQLAGEEIPKESRMLMIAEAFDSMFRKKTKNETIQDLYQRLKKGAHTSFDPHMIENYEEFVTSYYASQKTEDILYLDLGQLEPGMVLAGEIRTLQNSLLLPKGTELTDALIKKLKNYGQRKIMDTIIVYTSDQIRGD
jgi:HD-GYP domain-containing protein (c-di-GMP phosphodiesterase class II)